MIRRPSMDGILLIDKPAGATSHDVVAWARRALGTREVGHTGTLDPMATGVLVLLVGEATKLSAHLTADAKRYDATLQFGVETATLDAEGAVTSRDDSPRAHPDARAVADALAAMVGPMQQVPPAVSAIKVDGVAMHERVRRGETVTLPPRAVSLDDARVLAVRDGDAGTACDVALGCSKGFYVRALARDLAAALGTVGHLTALRRTAAGRVAVEECLDGAVLRAARDDRSARETVQKSLRPFAFAATLMPTRTVPAEAATSLRHGRRVPDEGPDETVLVFDEQRAPVCIARRESGVLVVARGVAVAPN